MADQKAMKKRLKALMQRPENQICTDCPEKRPTWASLIVPPPDAPPGTEKIGSFMCLECSGSHRRLGVHISFVRSVNLDSWKEWEVRAMENGGNSKVNAIFEATLAQSGKTKPSNLADGPTRERFIRDKYERRKFYDPAGFAIQSGSAGISASNGVSNRGSFVTESRPGAPSDAARRRVASRQARMKLQISNVQAVNEPAAEVAGARIPTASIEKAPISAPVEFDLLDFGSETVTSTDQSSSDAAGRGLFSSQPTIATVGTTTQTNHFAHEIQKHSISPPPNTPPPTSSSTTLAVELLKNPAPTTKPSTSNDDIMALFGPPKQQQQQPSSGFGMHSMNQMNPSNSVSINMMNNRMMSHQRNQTQNARTMSFNNQQNMMSSQQQQQIMMHMQNNNMMINSSQIFPQHVMMQQQMMIQQQMANQLKINNSSAMGNMSMYSTAGNGVNNSFAGKFNNDSNVNSAIQGMQNLSVGNVMARQAKDEGGFGTPMGVSSQQQTMKNDAFSSLGGMNAFR